MKAKDLKRALIEKVRELGGQPYKEQIVIEQSAELLDGIQRMMERELALDTLSRNWRTTALINEALARMEDGSYGTCQDCDEQIPERRLRALPWAKFCISCQERADRESSGMAEAMAA